MDSDGFPLPIDVQLAVLETCFDFNVQPENEQWSVDSTYFDYYRQVIESSRSRSWSVTKTHGDILDIVQLLRQNRTRDAIQATLNNRLSKDEIDDAEEIIEGSLNLAVRLLLMVFTGGSLSMGRPLTVSGETRFDWKVGTVKDLMVGRMSPEVQITEKVKLEKIFNARNLERIGAIKVRWTSNLADHLRMRDDDSAVELFHYASFLRFHQHCSIFPTGLVDETISTLALLLPEHDEDVKEWFQQEQLNVQKQGRFRLDPLARECGQLKVSERKIEKFEYYHDRLVILKQVFDEAEPRNITQWWHDRRKKVQWYTFWVAAIVLALTIFFGLIQCVEGALQVYLAWKAAV